MKPFNEKDAETRKVELIHNLPEGVEIALRNIRVQTRSSDGTVVERTVDVDVGDMSYTLPLEEDYTFKVQYKDKSYTVTLMLSDEEASHATVAIDKIKVVKGDPDATLDAIVKYIIKTAKNMGVRSLPPPEDLLRGVLGAANVTEEIEIKFKEKLVDATVAAIGGVDDDDDEDEDEYPNPFSDVTIPLDALRKLYGKANMDCLYKQALRLSKILHHTYKAAGKREIQPVVTPLAKGTTYYTPGGASDEFATVERKWDDSPLDYRRLVFGQVFETESDAAVATMLMATPTCLALYDRAVSLTNNT